MTAEFERDTPPPEPYHLPFLDAHGADETWRALGECQHPEYPPFIFFPSPRDVEMEAAAKAVCRVCAVSDECLRFAMQTNQQYGVWGGLSEAERKRLRRNKKLRTYVRSDPVGLTDSERAEIAARHARGELKYDLADEYQVSLTTVVNIVQKAECADVIPMRGAK